MDHEGGPSRGRGSRALVSFAGTRTTAPLDELTRCSCTPLRFVCCARTRSSPRPPARPGAGPPEAQTAATPGVPAAARPPRQSLPVGQLGGTPAAQPPQRVNGAVTALTWHSRLSRTPSSPRHSSQDRRVLSQRVRRCATMSSPQPFEKLLCCRVRAQCAAQRGECCGKAAFVQPEQVAQEGVRALHFDAECRQLSDAEVPDVLRDQAHDRCVPVVVLGVRDVGTRSDVCG